MEKTLIAIDKRWLFCAINTAEKEEREAHLGVHRASAVNRASENLPQPRTLLWSGSNSLHCNRLTCSQAARIFPTAPESARPRAQHRRKFGRLPISATGSEV